MAASEQELNEILDRFIAQVYEDSCDENRVVRAVVKREPFTELVSSLRDWRDQHTKEAVAKAVRQANISQVENWRDWIKGDKDVAWLVREMDRAIETLKDESLTDENGVFRDVLAAPQQSTGGGDE